MGKLEQLKKQLENDFVDAVNKMDKSIEEAKQVRQNEQFSWSYKQDTLKNIGADTQHYASKSCYICDLFALLNDTSQDAEMERLYNKYNLWREE